MSDTFRQAYAALTDFIAHHPEIEIGETVTSIPGEVRPQFYNLFNAAREAFVEEKFPAFMSEAAMLWEQYRKAEESAANLFSLEEPAMASAIHSFLRNSQESLTRELFDPLFDLLKGRESVESFEEKAGSQIARLFPAVFRGSYEKWVILSFVSLLDVDKVLRVESRGLSPGERAKPAAQAPLDDVPIPAESASLLFSQPRSAIFAVPDLIVHSSRLNRFIGIRSEFSEGLYNAWNPSTKRDWYPIDTDMLILLESGLTLIYAAEDADDLALVADAQNICRPDLILWCIDTRSLDKKEALEYMVKANSLFHPTNGSYIIANYPWPEAAEPSEPSQSPVTEQQEPAADQTQAADIKIINAGYDQSSLAPIAEAFAVSDGANTDA
jgi:hypothetical protein